MLVHTTLAETIGFEQQVLTKKNALRAVTLWKSESPMHPEIAAQNGTMALGYPTNISKYYLLYLRRSCWSRYHFQDLYTNASEDRCSWP